MAVFGPPPNPALREEWRNLSAETRRAALAVLFGPRGLTDQEVEERLVDLGLSPDLSRWASAEALERIRMLARMFESEPRSRTRLDRFNGTLLALIFTMLSLTWFAQEVRALQGGHPTLGIFPAAIVTTLAITVFLAFLRGWIRSLRR